MHLLVLNGPNLNLLGLREPELYGHFTYNDLVKNLTQLAKELNIHISFYQSNHEGALVDAIQEAYGKADGIIFNPAAYTHTSIALLDALKAVDIPTVEVHITNPLTREIFRHVSYVGMAAVHTIRGQGPDGYQQAVRWMVDYLSNKKEA